MTAGFSELPFAAGTVRGLRSFRMVSANCSCSACREAEVGLYAVTNAYAWTPGENLAVCIPQMPFNWWPERKDHRPAMKECTCGFYAYFGRRNDYAMHAEVAGIVEGYGLVTVGHLGFRAEKARIVALAFPVRLSSFPLEQYGVPIYQSVEQMLYRHPTTRPEDVGINSADYPVEPSPYGWTTGLWLSNGTIANVQAVSTALQQHGSSAAQAGLGLAALAQVTVEDERTPLERKRAVAEAAAERRRQLGLRNSGGFDKRGRRQ